MTVFDLYSKRLKRTKGDVADVYQYEELPDTLRIQITHMWDDAIGDNEQFHDRYAADKTKAAYELLVNTLRREYGVYSLSDHYTIKNEREELRSFLLNEESIERCLDVIELSFRAINRLCRQWSGQYNKLADDTIDELNKRFEEHGVGYCYENGIIIRVDNKYTHSEIIKPALKILSVSYLDGAREEFLSALEHRRHNKQKEALNDCLKSFESTMKAICLKRKWTHKKNATASALIQTLLDNDIIPPYWQTQCSSLKSLLESSVPTGRNKLSGHGQGTTPTTIPNHLADYMINMTGACIVFLAEAENALP